MMEGKLIIFCAPSGSGKSTIVQHLMKQVETLSFSISATSRQPRPGEKEGREYYFISPEKFREKVRNEEFIEWEEVYPDQYYGTLRSEVERIWDLGKHSVFDIDVVGGLNLKRQFGDRALSVFVQAPSIEILEQRLRNRGADDEESLLKRLEKAEYELGFAPEFDLILVNEQLEDALKEAQQLVRDFIQQK